MTLDALRPCEHQAHGRQPCNKPAINGYRYCTTHEPVIRDRKRRSRAKRRARESRR